jgi:hypothetical protein
MKELNNALAKIQQGLKAPKNQINKFGGYNYRSCEDILEAVKPLLGKLTLTISDDMVNIGDRYYVKATARLTDGENLIETSALAREAEVKKGMDASQITGSASSYARKYALNGLFAIDDTKDADTKDNKEDDGFMEALTGGDKPLRDSKGHTYCSKCGKVVSKKVEKYSMDRYGKVLCVDHQKEGK